MRRRPPTTARLIAAMALSVAAAACGGDDAGPTAAPPAETEDATDGMPDVVGLSERVAVDRLEGLGLSVATVDGTDPDRPDGAVLDQAPAPGRDVAEGDAAVLTVNRADDPEPSPSPAPTVDEPTPAGDPTTESAATGGSPATGAGGGQIVAGKAGLTAWRPESYPTGYVSVGSEVTNTSDRAAGDFRVTLTLVDADGNVTDSDDHLVGFLQPGETTYPTSNFYLNAGDPVPVDVEITIRQPEEWHDAWPPPLAFSDVTYSGEHGIRGTVTNTLDRQIDKWQVVCATYDSSGDVTGGGYTFTNTIDPGGRSGFRITGLAEDIDAAEVRCAADRFGFMDTYGG